MRAVNLASKPFINRRPVIRIALLVWIAAIALTVVNIWSYGDFFRIASNHRARLADLEKEIRIEEQQVETLEKRIEGLKLDDGNTKASYLNGLIHQRIFPWSRLFDEIQDVLPKDVYLVGLAPEIERLESQRGPRRTSSTSSSRPRTTTSRTSTAKKQAAKALDRVQLKLQGVARSDEALLDLVDRLYASPTFLDPTLSTESREERSGLVAFQIEVTYLTGTGSPKAAAVAAAGSGTGATAGAPLAEGAEAGNLYGQPGFSPPTGTSSGAPATGGAQAGDTGAAGFQPERRPTSRPGFEPDPRAGTAAGRTGSPTRPSLPGQPGFVPAGPQDGGTVVIPRRSPGALGTTPSSSPRLGAGGG